MTDPFKQGEAEDILNDTSAAEAAQKIRDETKEIEDAAMQKAIKESQKTTEADTTGKDDTFIGDKDLGFLNGK